MIIYSYGLLPGILLGSFKSINYYSNIADLAKHLYVANSPTITTYLVVCFIDEENKMKVDRYFNKEEIQKYNRLCYAYRLLNDS